uniref:HDC00943 n=1 Tax=Drosophila melanogaster TaxID=7227 RepID=Q6IHU2_DROME|nr:TPA_inf: HDC00943 [Drosophila melanogaster]
MATSSSELASAKRQDNPFDQSATSRIQLPICQPLNSVANFQGFARGHSELELELPSYCIFMTFEGALLCSMTSIARIESATWSPQGTNIKTNGMKVVVAVKGSSVCLRPSQILGLCELSRLAASRPNYSNPAYVLYKFESVKRAESPSLNGAYGMNCLQIS